MALEEAFIKQTLAQYGTEVRDAMMLEIRRLEAVDSRDLLRSIDYQVHRPEGSNSGAVDIRFPDYGRFVDMGAGRLNTVESRRNTRARKPKKIYSPVVYGLLGTLIGRLSYGYTQETIRILKAALQT